MFFGERDTIEFRLHTATTNATKIVTWLFTCNAILKYAEANKKKILTTSDAISMDEIFEYYAKANPRNKHALFVTDYLKAYFKKRCADFKKDLDRKDYLSAWDMEEDKKFVFKLDGKSLV